MKPAWKRTVAALITTLGACAPDTVDPAGVTPDAGPDAGLTSADTGALPDGNFAPMTVGPPTGKPPRDPSCDLNGRWLVAQRELASALGQEQVAHNWFYFEVRHEDADVVLTRGLHCGFEVLKRSALSASVDSSAAWPAFLARNSSTGRRGTFVKEGSGCRLTLQREYTVRGATVSHYSNPAIKLPSRTERAEGQTPGWEDWDNDGNPGISLVVTSALAGGTLYTCQRDWTEYNGLTQVPPKLKVAITYGAEQIPLGRSAGAPQVIESTSAPSSDSSQHYAWWHRLPDGAATGSDAEICAAVRSMKNQLVPEAND
jgi:hypothetical protein